MLKDITLGQYFPLESTIHKIDSRVKIIAAIIFVVAVFMCSSPMSFAVAVLLNVLIILASKINFKIILGALKPVLFIIIFTGLINLFLTDGEYVVFSWKFLKITTAGISSAITMALRIVLLVSYTSLLTFTTSPILLTDGIESLLKPFSKIGLPAHELAMMMTIALRFIPTLLEETDKIIMAQKSRGADFESGNLVKRAKALVPILVPLFINSFRRADELATAMECRCYRGSENRTRLRELKLKRCDIFASVSVVASAAIIIFLGVCGI